MIADYETAARENRPDWAEFVADAKAEPASIAFEVEEFSADFDRLCGRPDDGEGETFDRLQRAVREWIDGLDAPPSEMLDRVRAAFPDAAPGYPFGVELPMADATVLVTPDGEDGGEWRVGVYDTAGRADGDDDGVLVEVGTADDVMDLLGQLSTVTHPGGAGFAASAQRWLDGADGTMIAGLIEPGAGWKRRLHNGDQVRVAGSDVPWLMSGEPREAEPGVWKFPAVRGDGGEWREFDEGDIG